MGLFLVRFGLTLSIVAYVYVWMCMCTALFVFGIKSFSASYIEMLTLVAMGLGIDLG